MVEEEEVEEEKEEEEEILRWLTGIPFSLLSSSALRALLFIVW